MTPEQIVDAVTRRLNGVAVIEDMMDAPEPCIRLSLPDGEVIEFPYEESGEFRDQRRNACDEVARRKLWLEDRT